MRWNFWSKKKPLDDDPFLKTYTIWLSELREVCEQNFDAPEQARLRIREMQVEWKQAFDDTILSEINRDGLESRAFRLLTCEDHEWLSWLDDLAFWKPGWRPVVDEEDS